MITLQSLRNIFDTIAPSPFTILIFIFSSLQALCLSHVCVRCAGLRESEFSEKGKGLNITRLWQL